MRFDELKIEKPHSDDTLGVKRKHMPQISKEDYKALFSYLYDNGVSIKKVSVVPTELKSTQGEFSDHGVEKAMTNGKMNKPIIISADNYVLDGHHRWLGAKNGRIHSLNAFQLSVSAKEGLNLLANFPKTTFKDIYTEGYKIQLERDPNMYVLHITDTKTGKRTEVRGKSGYESGGYDANDKLHQLLDRVGKSANISELINGEIVTINPKHPDATKAQKATDVAFNEAAGVGRVVKGVNTTVDVGPNEIIKQVKKYGNNVDRDGKPKLNLK